jgi:antitoxin VapB
MGMERHMKLFRNGRSQAVRIPREFELPGKVAIIRKVGNRLILEPKRRKKSLAELFASWETTEEEFPPIPELPHDAPPDL